MDKDILRKHIKQFSDKASKHPERFKEDYQERLDHNSYYQNFTAAKMLSMSEEDVYSYLKDLWAMLIWGNKHYVVDKILEENGLDHFRKSLANLVWGSEDIAERWTKFRKAIKGMGPAMMSEVLCKTHPDIYVIWNRRAYVGLNYLQVEDLPKYDYQLTGAKYKYLCDVCKDIAAEFKAAGIEDSSLFAVDYFIWEELQFEDNLSKIFSKIPADHEEIKPTTPEEIEFIHDDIRDKLRDIGQWLGFDAKTEQKVSDGSKVDTIWQATIGNMGRVIYVFEVQTGGDIKSLILNLIKAQNNAAVQGVVAVSDQQQLEKIKKYVADVKDLKDTLKYWDYEDVLKVYDSLEFVNLSINELGLVPQGF